MKQFSSEDLETALLRLYEAYTDAPAVYVAACCDRVSLARTPQTVCATCPKTPAPVRVANATELSAWVHAHAEGLVNPPAG